MDNNARLVNEKVEFTANGSAMISGRLEICINDEWAALCDDESLSDRLADIACNSISHQYNSKLLISWASCSLPLSLQLALSFSFLPLSISPSSLLCLFSYPPLPFSLCLCSFFS